MNNFDPLTDFKDVQIVIKEIEKIHQLSSEIKRDIFLMEVCGTHTMQISKFGLRKLMPQNIKLISGPGCPVCVTSQEYVDKAIYLTENYDFIVTTFGDLFRVPGTKGSLEQQKSKGKDIRIIYSPEEALQIAQQTPQKNILFLSIGFETTMPATACVVKEAKNKKIKNLYFLLGNKFFLPAFDGIIALSRKNGGSLDGFILPGHLSAIIGEKSYVFLKENYGIPGVITGFEPVDIILGIKLLLEMILEKKSQIKNEYTRVVTYEGNICAKNLIDEVFDRKDGIWRGIGEIPNSEAKFKKEYKEFDIENHIKIPQLSPKEKLHCRCSDVLIGKITPFECSLFAKMCNPENPVGACMVSSEGSCAAYYKYERVV